MEQKNKDMLSMYPSQNYNDLSIKQYYPDFFSFLDSVNYDYNFDDVSSLIFANDHTSCENSQSPYLANYNLLKNIINFLKSKCTDKSYTQDLLDEMFSFVKANSSTSLDFISLIIKYCSLKFSNEIEYEFINSKDFLKCDDCELMGYAKLGNLKLASLKALKVDYIYGICFYNLKTMKCLGNQHIEQCLLKQLFKFVNDNFQGYDIHVTNVGKANYSTQQFYAKYGGEFFENDYKLISSKRINDISKNSLSVIFGHQAINNLISSDLSPLSLDEYLIQDNNCEIEKNN